MYSFAIVAQSDSPGSLFWICHQEMVTGLPDGEAAADGAADTAAPDGAGADGDAADGAALDELFEQALKTIAVVVNRTAAPRRNFMDLASCLIRCRNTRAGAEQRWRRLPVRSGGAVGAHSARQLRGVGGGGGRSTIAGALVRAVRAISSPRQLEERMTGRGDRLEPSSFLGSRSSILLEPESCDPAAD